MGRRPKPKALKLVTGNPGGRPIRDDEPDPVPGAPVQPAGLPKAAAEEWDRLVAQLEAEQRLGTADRSHLLGAAMAYSSAMETRRRLSGRGIPADLWLRLKTGERMQWESYRKFCNDLCLSQGTRARASTSGGRGKETSKLERFFSKRASSGDKAG